VIDSEMSIRESASIDSMVVGSSEFAADIKINNDGVHAFSNSRKTSEGDWAF
tara:strand:- start:1438 stop:1593 length:156 start_codon:yes stop_codon:yes gene_type:complete